MDLLHLDRAGTDSSARKMILMTPETPIYSRSGFDRRVGVDRREVFDLDCMDMLSHERRGRNERRNQDEKRNGWIRYNEWVSVFVGSEYL
ncbi:MAG: hypothetical protein KKE17_13455 [Proteobacteria bacterium]|nr:hypothetical protein [Pseudomonadota bacterium]MBU1711003.1 hypothetical protein [Pseudomonadota bacterium]